MPPTLESPAEAARLDVASALESLGSDGAAGLSSEEAARRLAATGHNAIRSHGARPWNVLLRQVRSPLLLLLVVAAIVSATVGEGTDAVIILVIVLISVGLGFLNEFRAERAVEALHERIRHTAIVVRDGRRRPVDVTELVPGDIVLLDVGDVVPADLRVVEANGLECDEAILTGESLPSAKAPAASGADGAALAYMGTVVSSGTGAAVVVATGGRTEFGRIAARLGARQPATAFQLGLRDFSMLLVWVTAILTVGIFVINAVLQRPLIDALLFSLAIAVGLTPQLLPAIVTISLATGAERLARRKVIVKRLVAIEDLGNITVLFTDKTGTLTAGSLSLAAAVDASDRESAEVLRRGLLCNAAVVEEGHAVGGNPLDRAVWEAPAARAVDVAGVKRVASLPFDYERRMMTVLVREPDGTLLQITKGAPESVLERCTPSAAAAHAVAERHFDEGARLVAVASRVREAGTAKLTAEDERDLVLDGFLVLLDPPKADAAHALRRLHRLGVGVKIVTGDNERVARHVCAQVGLPATHVVTGTELDGMTDEQLRAGIRGIHVFARVTPEQKARVIRVEHSVGADVGFLGDGVNDAVALREADVGISVDSATEVAKDAADLVLTEKDLGILADGIVEGRRIFANTIKYVLMGTSSNFGNMFSAAGASLFLPFLPMLPTQILLNNLLYDVSEMTIPTDHVDEEMLRRPSHWNMRFIRRFMIFFGPISSIYDFMTFFVMLWLFRAGKQLFHSAWFVESLLTQSLVIFVIRTRRVPFLRSLPSTPLGLTTLASCAIAFWLPFSPLAQTLGFVALPIEFVAILAGMIATYLLLVQIGVALFFRMSHEGPPIARPRSTGERRLHRVASRFSRRRPLPRTPRRPRRRASAAPPASPA